MNEKHNADDLPLNSCMRWHCSFSSRLTLVLLGGSIQALSSASLLNASFEDPPLPPGQYIATGTEGWINGTGVWHIPTTGFYQANAPDGLQIGYTNNARMAQQSSNVVGVGTNSVTLQAGRRHDSFAGSFNLNVYAGGNVSSTGVVTGGNLIATANFDFTTVAIDSFTPITASYTALPGDPNLGQFITVQLERTNGSQVNVDDVRITSPASTTVLATGLSVQLGKVQSGDVTSLQAPENIALVVCKFFVPNQSSPFVQMVVDGTTPLTPPTALRFRVKSSMVNGGGFNQTLSLFNFVTNAYEETRTDSIGTSTTYYDLNATGDPARYVGAGGALRSRIQVKQLGPSTTLCPCASFDMANWDVTKL